jgi:hypothetical protein
MEEFNRSKEINKRLWRNYGSNPVGQPSFRIVFSEDQREKRFGKYAEYTGKLFLREFQGLYEVPKYPFLKPPCFVLERWMPPELAFTHEIPATREGSYEPVFVFNDPKGNPLPPQEEVANKVITALLNPLLPGDRASQLRTEDENEIRREIEQNYIELEDQGRSWIGHRIHSGESNLSKVHKGR